MTQETETVSIDFRRGQEHSDEWGAPYSLMLEFLRKNWADHDYFALWYPKQEALWYYP